MTESIVLSDTIVQFEYIPSNPENDRYDKDVRRNLPKTTQTIETIIKRL